MLDGIFNAMGELERSGIKPHHVIIKLNEQDYYSVSEELAKHMHPTDSKRILIDGMSGYINKIWTPNGQVVIENIGRGIPNGQPTR